MRFDKRGLSAVVAVVLLVLLVIVLIMLLWLLIIPMLRNSFPENVHDIYINFNEGYTCYDTVNKVSYVQIEKGPEQVNLSGVMVVFMKGGNSHKFYTDSPELNSKRVFTFNISGQLDKVQVAPVIKKGNKYSIGDFTSYGPIKNCAVNLPPPGDVFQEDCGDGKCDSSESCSSCPGDCGACPVPRCDDGHCDSGENCASCPSDCGCDSSAREICSYYEKRCGVEVNSCIDLKEEGKLYVLGNEVSLTSKKTCFSITANDVIFDLNHFNVIGYRKYGWGIHVSGNKDNAVIENGKISNFDTGVGIEEGLLHTVRNITVVDNKIGIISKTNHSIIEDNLARGNTKEGITIKQTTDNTFRRNNMTGNTVNFKIEGENNGESILEKYYLHNIDDSNIVNNSYKVYYRYDVSDTVFDKTNLPDAGTFICVKCNNVTVKDLNVSHTNWFGILFFNSTNFTITNVTSFYNHAAISLLYDDNFSVFDNTLNGTSYGIYMLFNTHDHIENNKYVAV